MSYNVYNTNMADCLNKLRVYDLNQLCRKFLLPQHGKKVAIVERILEYITDVEREEQIYEFILATKPSIFDLISGRRINNPLNNNIISNSHSNNNKYFSNNNNFFLSNNNNHANNLFLCNNNDSVNHSNSENSVIKKNNLPVERKGKGMNKNVISKNCIVKCIECNKLQHVSCYTQNACVNKDLNNYKILCVVCRLRDIDPFYPLKKVLWMKNLNVNSEKLVINACDIKSWRNENKEVIIFCMHIDKKNLSTNVNLKQEWPRTFILKVNGNVIEKIFEPSWEHKRRDSPLKITHTLKAGNNNIDINITNYEIPKLYVVAFLLCNIETEQSIIENVIVNSSLNFKDSKQRIINILLTKHDDDEVMCMEINRKISLHCPFSLDRILIPCRGVKCCHIQCFDLKSFIDVTKKTKAFNNRWKCPVCSLFLRPKDLVIDTFITYILSQVPKDIKEVELSKSGEIIFNHNSVEGKVIKQVDDIDSVNLQKSKIEIKTEYNTGDKDNIFSPNEIIILDSDPEDNNNCSSFEKSSVQKNHNVTQGEQEVIYISDSDNEDSLPQTTHNIDKKGNEENSPFLFGMNNYSTNKSVNNFLMRNIKGLDKRNFLPNSRIFFNHMVLDVLNDISKIHVNEKLSTVNMQKERTPDPNNNTNTNNNNSGSNHSGNNHSSSSDINTRSNTNINSNINHNNNNDYNYNNSSNNSNSNNNNNNSNNINSNSNNINSNSNNINSNSNNINSNSNNINSNSNNINSNSNNINSNSNNINSNSNNINSNSNNINSNSNSNNINSNSNNINSNSNNNEISSAPPLGFYNKRSILAKDIYLLSSQNALSLKTNNEYISNRDSVEDNNLFYLNNVKNGKICCTPTPQGKDNIISINNNLVAVSNTLLSLNKDISCNNSIASSRKYSNGNRNYNRISASNDNIIGGSMDNIIGGSMDNIIGGSMDNIIGGSMGNIIGGSMDNIIGGSMGNIIGGSMDNIIGGSMGNIIGGSMDNIIGGSMGNIIGGSMGNNGKSKEHLSLLDIKKMSEALFSENESNNRACSSEEQNFIINDKSCIGENKSNFYLKIEGRSIFDKDKLPNNEITSLNNFESYKYLDSDLRDILVDENKQNKKKKKRKKKERRSNTMEKIRKYDSFSSNFNFSMINFKSKYSRCKQLKDSNNNNSNKNSSSSSNNNNNNSSKNNSTSNNNDNNNSSRNRSNSKNSNKCKSCSSTNIKNKIYHVMNRSRYTKKTNSKNDSLNGKKSKKKKKNKK
ncbi:E3 SUMO-protein ligase PIAS, putative [Plasmodium malariae]|uniref:E3 SUMO-protein ligase PIAS, putative n=1 Tax=Plasmodium malariae TaxID=5858 RepID=A0A1D3SNM4_PLAMA|nr:E3 SUMO-protein ligase PIAS, putative [Plasmodium malariae]SCO93003.1 E3 SUMO-protein ligase PIAS, putative [Plasmodium malariae]